MAPVIGPRIFGVDREALGGAVICANVSPVYVTSDGLVLLGVATVVSAAEGELPQGGELGLGEIQFSQDDKDPVALA